jgi:hypothetical protein
VRIDLGVGPREVDLIETLDKWHDPLFLNQRCLSMVELNFDPLPDRQGNQFDASRGGRAGQDHAGDNRCAQNQMAKSHENAPEQVVRVAAAESGWPSDKVDAI